MESDGGATSVGDLVIRLRTDTRDLDRMVEDGEKAMDKLASRAKRAPVTIPLRLKPDEPAIQKDLSESLKFKPLRDVSDRTLAQQLARHEQAQQIREHRANTQFLNTLYEELSRGVDTAVERQATRNTGNGHGEGNEQGDHGSHSMFSRHSPFMISARMTAGAVGMPGVAGEMMHVGHLAGALGPAAVGVAGAVGIVETIHRIHEGTIELREATVEYNNELRNTANRWRDIAEEQIESTEIGRSYRTEANKLRDDALQMQDQEDSRLRNRGFFEKSEIGLGMGLEAIYKGGFGNTNEMKTRQLNQQRINEKWGQSFEQFSEAQDQLNVGRERRAADRESNLEREKIVANTYEGPEKQKKILENQRTLERRHLDEQNHDRLKKYTDDMNARIKTLHGDAMVDAIDERDEEIHKIEKENADKLTNFDAITAEKRQGITWEWEQRAVQDVYAGQNARIELNQTGWARQDALLKAHGEQQVKEYEKQGRDTTQIKENNQINEARSLKEHNRDIGFQLEDLDYRVQSANRSVPESEIAWNKWARTLQLDLSLTAQQLEQFHNEFRKATQAEANRPVNDSIKELNVELDLAERKITDVEAGFRKLRLANPEANPELLQQQAELQQKVESAHFIQAERERLFPAAAFQEYARKMKAALASGEVSSQDALYMLQRKRQEMFAPIDTGNFNAGGGAGYQGKYIDVKAMNMNVGQDNVKISVEDGNKILLRIDDKLGHISQQEALN